MSLHVQRGTTFWLYHDDFKDLHVKNKIITTKEQHWEFHLIETQLKENQIIGAQETLNRLFIFM